MKDLSLFILAGSLNPWSLGSLDSEMIRERLKSVFFWLVQWIPGALHPWILRRLAKDLSLFILAGSLDPWILGQLGKDSSLLVFAGSPDPWILEF